MAEYRKTRNINELKVNEAVKDIFVVRFKKPPERTQRGTYYFSLKLQDAFGDIMMKYWGSENEAAVQKLYDSINAEEVVYVDGFAKDYNGRLELSVNEGCLKVLGKGEYDLADFIRKSGKDAEKMFSELLETISSIKNPQLRAVLNAFFEDNEFVERFKYAPGAMYKHHGWVSGLLEHTLSVVKLCSDIAKYHSLDNDLLLSGAILHDIGKIEEFETTSLIKVTDKGNLLGHIVLGVQMLSKRMEGLEMEEETKNKLLHIMISHHGCLEYGCPKPPSFPEAFIVARADELDALAVQMIDFKANAMTEDSFLYSKDFGTNVYLK